MSTLLGGMETEPSPPRTGLIFFWFSLSLVALLVLGIVVFALLRLVPDMRQRAALNLDVTLARANLASSEQLFASLPARYQTQLDNANERLTEVAGDFLAESLPARLLDRFDIYGRAAGVEIVDLQIQPSPAADAFNRRNFALRVVGTFDELLDFLARIEEVALPGLVLGDLKIAADGEERFVLNMTASMYTSVYATETPLNALEDAATESARTTALRPAPLASPEELPGLQGDLDASWSGNNWANAIEITTKILSLLPENPDVIETLYRAHVNYGYHLLAARLPAEAEEQFAAALTIKPTGQEALDESRQLVENPVPAEGVEEQLVESLRLSTESGDWKEVIRLLRLIQTINPQHEGLNDLLYNAYMKYGAQLEAEGRPDLAQEQYNQAQAILDSQTPTEFATPSPTPP